MQVFLFALFAAVGNALFVYGQRASQTAENPFFFLLATLSVCITLFAISAMLSKAPMEGAYLTANLKPILISGVGFYITFIGFYWLYTQHGAFGYTLYALLAILTTAIGVGLVIFREPFNKFHVISGLLAVAAILVFGIGQQKLAS